MTEATLAQVVTNMQAPTYVAPVDDADLGWQMFFAGHDVSRCRNDVQRQAWEAARSYGYALLCDERNHADYGPSIEDDYWDIRRGN